MKTVADLIEVLKRFPLDAQIAIDDGEDFVDIVDVQGCGIKPPCHVALMMEVCK